MSFFNWFSARPALTNHSGDSDSGVQGTSFRSQPMREKGEPMPSQRPSTDTPHRNEERKVKRHARREQLYIAVREAMTHSGVLSASYKFKVLSLDQRGDQFMVMMDVDQSVDSQAEHLNGIESKIVQTAKARFEILVSSVYWRMTAQGTSLHGKTAALYPQQAVVAPAVHEAPALPAPAAEPRKPVSRYEPIQDDEVAAFKLALAAVSANPPVPAGVNGKTRSGPRSYTLLTGFEDTEMPESYAAPVLSNTQYGDLN